MSVGEARMRPLVMSNRENRSNGRTRRTGSPGSLPAKSVGLALVGVAVAVFAGDAVAEDDIMVNPATLEMGETDNSKGAGGGGSSTAGAATYALPIDVPPGRNGMTPSVVLTYSSFGPQYSHVAPGWSLPTQAIERRRRGLSYDGTDFVYRNGGQAIDLVSCASTGGCGAQASWNEYRAKIEDADYLRFFREGDHWVAFGLSGTKYVFGADATSRQDDPADPAKVFKWSLDRIEDSSGNAIEYRYLKNAGEVYLDTIEYGTALNRQGVVARDAHGVVGASTRVRFIYREGNSSPRQYYAKFATYAGRTLSEIAVDALTSNGWAVLTKYAFRGSLSVKRVSGGGGRELPAVTFKYSQPYSHQLAVRSVQVGFVARALSGDFNGDGRTDVAHPQNLATNLSHWAVWDGTDRNDSLSAGGWDVEGAGHNTAVGDFNGDGRSDMAVSKPGLKYWHVSLSGLPVRGDDENQDWSTNGSDAVYRQGGFLYVGDFNGDGLHDIATRRSGEGKQGSWQIALSNGSGFSVAQWSTTPEDRIELGGHKFGDFNGDGRTDVASFADGKWWVSLANREGSRFDTSEWSGPESGGGVFIDDVNSDGLDDLTSLACGQLHRKGVCTISRSNPNCIDRSGCNGTQPECSPLLGTYGWSVELEEGCKRETWYSNGVGGFVLWGRNTLWMPIPERVVRGDFNGDGVPEFAFRRERQWFRSNGTPLAPPDGVDDHGRSVYVGDFSGNGCAGILMETGSDVWTLIDGPCTPVLLSEVDNGVGGKTSFEYASSASFDTSRQYPGPNSLPSPIRVVTRIESRSAPEDSEIGGAPAVQTFSYHGPLFARTSREFCGFATVGEVRPDGVRTTTVFKRPDEPFDADLAGRPAYVGSGDTSVTMRWLKQGSSYPVRVLLSESTTVTNRSPPYHPYPVNAKRSYTYYPDGGVEWISMSTTGTMPVNVLSGAVHFTYWEAAIRGDPRHVMRAVRSTQVFDAAQRLIREQSVEYFDASPSNEGKEGKPRIVTVGGPDGVSREYDYHQIGGMLREVREPGADTADLTFTYDALTRTNIESVSNRLRRVFSRRLEYQVADGAITEIRGCEEDANSSKRCTVVDDLGHVKATNVTNSENAVVASSSYAYEETGFPRVWTEATLLDASRQEYARTVVLLDGLGNAVQVGRSGAESGGHTIERNYFDAAGRPYVSFGPFLGTDPRVLQAPGANSPHIWTLTEFDAAGWPSRLVRSDGAEGGVAGDGTRSGPTTVVDHDGYVTTVTGPTQRRRMIVRNGTGQIVRVIDFAENGRQVATSYGYDAAGSLVRVTDPRGIARTIEYDLAGRRVQIMDPDLGTVRYWYDARGRLQHVKRSDGSVETNVYDNLDRVEQRCRWTAPATGDPAADVGTRPMWTGDLSVCNTLTTIGYDAARNGRGRVSSIDNGTVVDSTIEYDAQGQAVETSRSIHGLVGSYATRLSLDAGGRVTEVRYPDGYRVRYGYFAGGGLLKYVQEEGGRVLGAYSMYEPTGLAGLTGMGCQSTDNAGCVSYVRSTFDPWSGKLQGIVAAGSNATGSAGDDLYNVGVAIDGAGDVRRLLDYRAGEALGAAGGVLGFEYSYDALGRLAKETVSDAAVLAGTTGRSITMAPRVFPSNGLDSVTTSDADYRCGYDAVGRMTDCVDMLGPVPAFRWMQYDFAGALRSVIDAGRGSMEAGYDESGTRAWKRAADGSRVFYVGPHYEVRVNAGGSDPVPVKYVFAGGVRLARIVSGQVSWFHKDHLGSTVALTDESGAAIWKGAYSPFGIMRWATSTPPTPYLYSDKEWDPESGLYYYGARYYDPGVARFVTPDSVVPRLYDTQALNRFAFARNNPVSRVDVDGHFDLSIIWEPMFSGGVPVGPYEDRWRGGNGGAGAQWTSTGSGGHSGYNPRPQSPSPLPTTSIAPVPTGVMGGSSGGASLAGPGGEGGWGKESPWSTQVIIWSPGPSLGASFGHVSVRIDDRSYSFDDQGMDIRPIAEYLRMNEYRTGRGIVLGLASEQEADLARYLSSHRDGYSFLFNNCTHPVQNWMKQKGLFPNVWWTQPVDLAMQLESLPVAIAETYYPSRP